ncbi:MAG TPA: CoA-binding protein [Nitrososphaeraceae archaeon]|jgi:predicted CoA-binding protein|nr:CoA-binding protein [Nitrososphaeraceae archaeon]
MNVDNYSDRELRKFYVLKNIAVVGMSAHREKPSHFVPEYLLQKGYNIIPVNPTTDEILQRKCYDRVSEIKQEVDIVNVFRKSEDVLDVIKDLLKKEGIKLIWLQKGIFNEEAMELAKKNRIDFVYNRCMMEEYERLFSS